MVLKLFLDTQKTFSDLHMFVVFTETEDNASRSRGKE